MNCDPFWPACGCRWSTAFAFSCVLAKGQKITSEAVMDSLPDDAGAVLSRFRADFPACLSARAGELCELTEAVLCADGPVKTLAGLSLAPEHCPDRRGAGSMPVSLRICHTVDGASS